MELIWNEQDENAVVHEVRSNSPEITLPETVEGRDLVAVGAYCFSDSFPIQLRIIQGRARSDFRLSAKIHLTVKKFPLPSIQ